MEVRTLIKGGTVVDGSGTTPAYLADVRIAGGRITEVGSNLQPTKGERVVDAAGCYVTPGFIETHNHWDGGVWWTPNLEPLPAYGALSNRKLDEQIEGARVAVEAHKRNPADFVLWKESAATEPGWSAAFSEAGQQVSIYGRPGWHIECSAMSHRYLGKTFDIHGGGIDLVFPHHENEIAQSCCAFGTDVMANVWMHNGFLQVEGQKMSKSLGNFVTIHELLATD